MAALVLPEALKRSRNITFQGLAKGIATTDELAAAIPMELCPDTSFRFEREASLGDGDFIADSGATSENSSSKIDKVEAPLRRIIGNVDVDNLANDLTGPSSGSWKATQLAMKAKGVWEKVKLKFINGGQVTSHTFAPTSSQVASVGAMTAMTYGPWIDEGRKGHGSIKYTNTGTLWQFRAPGDLDYGDAVEAATDGVYTLRSFNSAYFVNVTIVAATAVADFQTHVVFATTTNEFDGVKTMVDASMIIDPSATDGDAFDFALLNRLISTVKVRRNLAFFMNSSLIDKFFDECLAMNGAPPQMLNLPGLTGQVPAYRGIPILCNDNVLSNETVGSTTTCSSIYLAALDAQEGLGMAVANNGSTLNINADPFDTPVMGWRITDVGELEGYDHTRTRVKWIGTPFLRSKLALARRRGVLTA